MPAHFLRIKSDFLRINSVYLIVELKLGVAQCRKS